ncbi:MAG TPA: ABC transporter permease [Thermoanaerobaculia bacterium]|nr:ABC transporter permease [Thermoanaerobaculia bacterium]
MNHFYWQVRREIWENRSLYLAPIAACGVFMLGFPFALAKLIATIHNVGQHTSIAMPYDIFAGLQMAVMMMVGAFYCIDALYGERRDRSMLFWKSLPVSDLTSVLAKVAIPIAVLPVLTWLITIAAQLLMLLVSTVALAGNGSHVAMLWNDVSFFQRSLLLLYHLIMVHSLYLAPLYGWLLFVSAWVRRAPFVWATVPLLAIAFVERIAFGTTSFAALVGNRLAGNGMDAIVAHGTFPMDPHTHLTPIRFLTSPELVIGLLVCAIFVAAAMWMRRYRSAI